ncbi:hypothetical protein AF72_07600 [Xylella taiwanensis]|uniref:Uncharacterized protein n=1 Tax=Xylella taiwanensis TaxID=1444770 RepID=Z9JI57_9GAMM|nr:hypothetical protein AB672_05770 [Xylella taiwanensis]EWS78045.1 hypothetical protein AF72_07600 [Xylella taiwanensis]
MIHRVIDKFITINQLLLHRNYHLHDADVEMPEKALVLAPRGLSSHHGLASGLLKMPLSQGVKESGNAATACRTYSVARSYTLPIVWLMWSYQYAIQAMMRRRAGRLWCSPKGSTHTV